MQRVVVALWLALVGGPALAAGPTQADCDKPGSTRLLAPAKFAARDARAYWLDGTTLQWPGAPENGRYRLKRARGAPIALAPFDEALPKELAAQFRFIGDGPRFRVPESVDVRALLRDDVVLVRENADGSVADATRLQIPGALDALYAGDENVGFGARFHDGGGRFDVWAPTARNVAVCLFGGPQAPSQALLPLSRAADTGAWGAVSGDAPGLYYAYLVDVFVPGVGLVRNRVTDPYSIGLSANGKRSFTVDLNARDTLPPGWVGAQPPRRIDHNVDLSIYELHVRDFSRDDDTVPAEHRGKYLAFTHPDSNGMRHLRALADAGITDVHLLPVFDFSVVPERGCDPAASGNKDCFNWGYEPAHFSAPEGSYATDPDGLARIVEFRRMVQALHAAGLRVGMDVVYNHTSASGQDEASVLDRIVPGYYHRLDAKGEVERSTCCANTATEHRMMGKLMRDSVLQWAAHFGIDSFRFDLMGHQPRAVMEQLRDELRSSPIGRNVQLIGEGWNFGEVADGKRFVQASQSALGGSDIATFSDRARDAVRGGGPGDHVPALIDAKGWSNGANDPHLADLVRVGLAGTLRGGPTVDGKQVQYNGQPAGYAQSPNEVVNYVENHDNQTLFDIGVWKLPRDTSTEDRARVQLLAAATTAFSQGVAYWHAGIDVLRSKSLDRNSYDSGDAFNRLDWTYTDNGFGAGLPPAQDNAQDLDAMRPLLADAARIKPTPRDIAWTRDAFRDLLRIRASTSLFHLRSAGEVRKRVSFPAGNDARLVIAHIDGQGLPDANFGGAMVFLNADEAPRSVVIDSARGEAWSLHPVHQAPEAADKRATTATFDAPTGRFDIPARTAVVFVQPGSTQALPPLVTTTLPATLAATPAAQAVSQPENLRLDIQLPPHYDPQLRYPVLYMDDGQDLDPVRVRETLQVLYDRHAIAPLILVAITMPKDRMAGYGLSDRQAARSVVGPTKYGDVGANAHAYSQWVAQTLVPWVDAQYSTQATPEGRTVLGWSLGGLNAFDLAWQYPDVFARLGAFSPSFWIADAKDQRLAAGIVARDAPHPALRAYFAAGTAEETSDRDHDGVIDVIDDANEVAALLRKGGTQVKVVELKNGQHRQWAWAAMLPDFLLWAYGH
ncbi:DUF3372 domain-containing protein [Lysobacter sp. KIS68-7]|uniref:alpha-1,6-glucosidase domain-containing protein n=1 Tax=Lysobacter sp. KIS68-7 TaxID=2904252 RepID=UPI001E5CF3E2|nr:alpha-1,6-glucosidase domain-containing protein [Lysobacter sp. KIS68-7]UHQ19317.1 DUF3372 domain-containing protein [Lysobacter sp. KIS68-7]